MMRLKDEQGVTLIEVVLSMLLFAMIMAPLTALTMNSLHDLFRARETSQRTQSYTRSSYLFTSGLANAQMPLRQAGANQIEYRLRLDDGDRYVFIWKACTPGGGIQPGIYAAISSPRYNLVTNASFEDGAEDAYGAFRPTSNGFSDTNSGGASDNGVGYLRFGQNNQGYPDDANPASADPGSDSDAKPAKARTGTGTNPDTPTSGARLTWNLGQATLGYDSTDQSPQGTPYNQDYTIGAPAGWTRHYRDDENRGQAVAPTEWPQAERVTFAQAAQNADPTRPFPVAMVTPTGSIRAGSRALRLSTYGALDTRRVPDNPATPLVDESRYYLGPQPVRSTYAYMDSQTFTASPGTRFLVGGYMADLVDGTSASTDPKRRPRIEWFWVTGENGHEEVIPERSGAVTMPDTDDDTPDGGLNAASNDFNTFRYKVTRPAPEGTTGIRLRLTAGQFTQNDRALFDGIMLQPMSGPRIDTARVNDYAARATSGARSPHTFFDGSTIVTGSDIVNPVYQGITGLTTSAAWEPSATSTTATAFLSPSSYGTRGFVATPNGTLATTSTFQSKAQLLFSFEDSDFAAGGLCGSGAPALFEYYDGASPTGTQLPTGTQAQRATAAASARTVRVNLPVFRNPATQDTLRFPVGSTLSLGGTS
jgi:hypothetical protein